VPSDQFLSRVSTMLGERGLRAMGKLNVPVYRLTRGRLMNSIGDAPVLLLTTTGRKSGQPRTAPVCYLDDGGRVAVIGSNAGNVHEPAWSHNLKANPDAEIEIRGDGRRRVRARVTEGDERAELWRKMNAQYSGFDDYQARTSRNIAVFALEPR
jgi:deazaflavin-dependent oxidoreductase (nitroreductase family)